MNTQQSDKLNTNKINKAQLPTRGVSNVGDAMTSNQQNPHGGAPNGG
jgi:hypothetical protein